MAESSTAKNGFIINVTHGGTTNSQRVEGNSLTIGRSDECDLVLKLETLSRKHATVSLLDGKFFVLDHGSINGTFLNSDRIKPGAPVTVYPNEEIILGQDVVRLTVSYLPALSETTSPGTATAAGSTAPGRAARTVPGDDSTSPSLRKRPIPQVPHLTREQTEAIRPIQQAPRPIPAPAPVPTPVPAPTPVLVTEVEPLSVEPVQPEALAETAAESQAEAAPKPAPAAAPQPASSRAPQFHETNAATQSKIFEDPVSDELDALDLAEAPPANDDQEDVPSIHKFSEMTDTDVPERSLSKASTPPPPPEPVAAPAATATAPRKPAFSDSESRVSKIAVQPNPETRRAAENIILEAQKKAAALTQKAEMEADSRAKEIYKRAQDKLAKAEEIYHRRLNEAYQEVEDIYQKAQADSEASFREAKEKSDQIRQQSEEQAAELRQRTEEHCEQVLADAQKSARELKEKRLREAEEQVRKKSEEMQKAALAEKDARLARLEKDWAAELQKRRADLAAEEEKARERTAKELEAAKQNQEQVRERTARELETAKQNLEQVSKKLADVSSELTAKQAKADAALALIDQSEKKTAALVAQLEKTNDDLSKQNKKLAEVKAELLQLTKDKNQASGQLQSTKDALKQSETDLTNAKKSYSDEIKALREKLRVAKEESTQIDGVVTQKKEQAASIESSIVKAQEELKALKHTLATTKNDHNVLNSDVAKLKAVIKRLEGDQAQAEAKIKGAQSEYAVLRDQIGQITDSLQKAKSEYDVNLLQIREKFEHEKENFAKQEKEHFEQMKLETMRNVRKYEMDLLENIAVNRRRLSGELTVNVEAHIKENLSVLDSKKIQEVIDRTLRENVSITSKNDPTKNSQTTLVELKKRERIRVATAGAILGAAFLWGAQFTYETVRQNKAPMERQVAAIEQEQKEDLERRKFNPAQTRDFKMTYMDNVIYTDKFTDTYLSDPFQKQFLKAVTAYMFKTWRIDEEKVITLVSDSTTLVKTLAEKKEAINPNFVPQGLEKMRATEAEEVKKMSDLLGSQVRYESYKKFEKQFYETYSVQQ